MARLCDICAFQSGGTPSRQNPGYFNGDIPWVTTTALNGSTISLENANEWITLKAIEESAAKIVPVHSILVGTRVGVGKVAINLVPMSTSQDIISLIGIDQNQWNLDFLCKFLSSKSAYLNSQARGATIKGIKIETLAELELPNYSIPEQHLISSTFNSLEKSISLRKQQLSKLDELVKSRFIEMFGDPITNSKCLPTNNLGKVLLLKAGDFTAASDIAAEPTTDNIYPCYGGNGIRGYVAEYNQEGSYSLIGRQGALSGNVQYATGKFKNTEHALLVTPLIEMNSIWLNHLLINLDLQRYQTGAAQPGLSVKNLQEIPIIEVPKEDQCQFAAFVEQTDKSKFEIQTSLEKLETLKKALMQKYFG